MYATAAHALHRPRRRRLLPRALFWLVCLVALSLSAGFGVFSSHVSHLSAPPVEAPVDAIIVLTGGQSRIDAGVELLRSGKGRKLLISGVNPVARSEDLRRATGAERELFACCVDMDKAAMDTVGNAWESAKWMEANAFTSALLVTNNYHMPRSMLEMRRLAQDIRFVPYPVVNTRIDRGEWMLNADALRVLGTEYVKYLAALARDALDGPDSNVARPVDTAAMR